MENIDVPTNGSIIALRDWFVEVCKCVPTLALSVATELVEVCGITNSEEFPLLYEADPRWLDQLSCKIPNLTKMLINSNVEKIGKTPLRLLNVEEVAELITNCFLEFPYGQAFRENSINGFSLLCVEDVNKLKEFGVSHELHAASLLSMINSWKKAGIPRNLLTSSNEERIKMQIKQEKVQIKIPVESYKVERTEAPTTSAAIIPTGSVNNEDANTSIAAKQTVQIQEKATEEGEMLVEYDCASLISIDAPSVQIVAAAHSSSANASATAGSSAQHPMCIISSSDSNPSEDGQATKKRPLSLVQSTTLPSATSRTKFPRSAMPSHALLASDISVGGRIPRSGTATPCSPGSMSLATANSTALSSPAGGQATTTSPGGADRGEPHFDNEGEELLQFSSDDEEGSRGASPDCSSGDNHGDVDADYEDENRERFGPWGQYFSAQQEETGSGGAASSKQKIVAGNSDNNNSGAVAGGSGARTAASGADRHSASVSASSSSSSDSRKSQSGLRETAAEGSELTDKCDGNPTSSGSREGGNSNGNHSSSESASGSYSLRTNRRLSSVMIQAIATTSATVLTPNSGAKRPSKSISGGRREATIAKKGLDVLKTECHNILHSKEDKVLSHAVTYIGVAASKPGRESIEYIVSSGAYRRLLDFIHLALQLPTSFVYYVLRTVSLIVTRLDGIQEVLVLFEGTTMKDVLKLCLAKNDFVRQQALHLVSEIGVSPEQDLKQRVLKCGAVKVIIESYYDMGSFHAPKTVRRLQGQCATALYKLCSMSTPEQFSYFRPALRVILDILTSPTAAWDAVVEAAQAVTFLVVPGHPEQIDVLMENKIFDTLVATFQDPAKKSTIRWHASAFIWSVAKHCSNQQMRSLFKLMGMLGQVCQLEGAHPHLRSASLNTMQVMLQRGEYIIQQFVYHRDAIPARVMELLRVHRHPELVHGDAHSANCIIKYASFTLANAAIGANKDQMLKLLDQGLYPLLFKIIQLQGEPEKLEEAKLKGIHALSQVLVLCSEEVLAVQERAEKKYIFNAQRGWDFIRNLIIEFVVPHPVPWVAGQVSGANAGTSVGTSVGSSVVGVSSSSDAAAEIGLLSGQQQQQQQQQQGGEVEEDAVGGDESKMMQESAECGEQQVGKGAEGGISGAAVGSEEIAPGAAVLRWSEELREKAQALVDAARELELFS